MDLFSGAHACDVLFYSGRKTLCKINNFYAWRFGNKNLSALHAKKGFFYKLYCLINRDPEPCHARICDGKFFRAPIQELLPKGQKTAATAKYIAVANN